MSLIKPRIKLTTMHPYTLILCLLKGSKKYYYELEYWQRRKLKENDLSNEHYKYFYTKHFGLDESFYKGKRILDIGCGPRGSLEWAETAAERVGIDPLVESYRILGIDKHKMRYIKKGAEDIPFEEEYFDVVSSFNSLDHVDDLDQVIAEIIRVIAPGGLFLLITDVNHALTKREPIEFSWAIVSKFSSNLELLEEKHFERNSEGIYTSIRANIPYGHSNPKRRYGVLSVKFMKPLEHNYD